MASTEKYISRITSAHRDKPKFVATVEAVAHPAAAATAGILAIVPAFDLDTAVGAQLDILGEWIGRPRVLEVPAELVFFSLNTLGLGFNQGVWQGRFTPSTQFISLPDDIYRRLLRVKIAANHWDGSLVQMSAAWALLFQGLPGVTTSLQDNQDMSVTLTVTGTLPMILELLINSGTIPLKPAGVAVDFVQLP